MNSTLIQTSTNTSINTSTRTSVDPNYEQDGFKLNFHIIVIVLCIMLCSMLLRTIYVRCMQMNTHTYIDMIPINTTDIQYIEIEYPGHDAECSICQDKYMDSETLFTWCSLHPCEHKFHSKCIEPWIKSHNTCPLCRTIIPVLSF
jgi:hypothetical protein